MAKAKVAEAPAPVETQEEVAETTASEKKSIVDPKYRDRYKNRGPEWMADTLKEYGTLFKTIPAKAAVGEEGKEGYKPAVAERKIPDGVDVDTLFAIGAANGLDLAKYETQRDGHGFPGRFRMTVGNMLRATAKARHGMFVVDADGDSEWLDAPEEWLTAVGAPAEPTHNKDGSKIAKKVEPKAEEPSKLVKPTEKVADQTAAPSTKGGKKQK